MPPAPSPASAPQHWLWPPLLLLGSVTLVVAWLLVALATGSQAGWMAVAAAAEAAWMLRLGSLPSRKARIALAMLATVLIARAANWGIAAAHIGGSMGLAPWESALRMGPHLAWTLIGLANGTAEILWLLAGLAVAWWLAR